MHMDDVPGEARGMRARADRSSLPRCAGEGTAGFSAQQRATSRASRYDPRIVISTKGKAMRRIIPCLLGLASLACSSAAWSLDINGKSIGMSIDDVAKSYGKRWVCDAALSDGDKVCRKSAAVDEFPRLQNENLARHHVAIAYRFHDDKLVQIRVSRIEKGWFDDFLGALTKQYGEPKLDNGTAQDKSGKSFERKTARWEDGNAALRLSTNTPKPPAVDLVLYDAEYFAKANAAGDTGNANGG